MDTSKWLKDYRRAAVELRKLENMRPLFPKHQHNIRWIVSGSGGIELYLGGTVLTFPEAVNLAKWILTASDDQQEGTTHE